MANLPHYYPPTRCHLEQVLPGCEVPDAWHDVRSEIRNLPVANTCRSPLLAVKGKILGRKLPGQIAIIVAPETILRSHRRLVAKKWDYSRWRKGKPGPPPVPVSTTLIRELLRFTKRLDAASAAGK